ncbi:hypothetical protein pdam_00007754 [Pocillopora damicornis]|uniref:Uncharacterized protein n=1 Tax=Pocillopora damicornis TaxID=46731 RepID=A0A3M6V4S4_POCDA|nr:hypothetical protein pdam_00007754 [Pocillopora damicornis]
MSESHANVVSFDENVSTLSNLYERNEHLLVNETTVENMATIGTVYESMTRNQRTYLANQDNKHRLEDDCTDFSLNTSRNGVGEVSKRSRSKSKFSCKYGGARRDREPSRLQYKKIIKMFKKSKSSRKCIKRYIMYGMELEKYRNNQEVRQSFIVNMEGPDVTENHRDYNVRKSLNCSKRASQV